MKKLVLVASLILALGASLKAQDCATGYCPATITVHHKAGTVSPVTVNITYGVTKVTLGGSLGTRCFLTRNLGATTQPNAITDATLASAGWLWQFNRKQGFAMTSTTNIGTSLTPAPLASGWTTGISESGHWSAANDPCTLLLGSNWYVPTSDEFLTGLAGTLTCADMFDKYRMNWSYALYDNLQLDWDPGSRRIQVWTGTSITTVYAYAISGVTEGNTLSLLQKPKGEGSPVRCMRTY